MNLIDFRVILSRLSLSFTLQCTYSHTLSYVHVHSLGNVHAVSYVNTQRKIHWVMCTHRAISTHVMVVHIQRSKKNVLYVLYKHVRASCMCSNSNFRSSHHISNFYGCLLLPGQSRSVRLLMEGISDIFLVLLHVRLFVHLSVWTLVPTQTL